jgi:hypothetical protein
MNTVTKRMGGILKTALLSLLIATSIAMYGQKKPSKSGEVRNKELDVTKKKIRIMKPDVFLGSSSFSGGFIQRDSFNLLARMPLSASDSFGNKYKVIGFDFTYAERNIYEDSVANLVVLVDYIYEYCPGDTLPTGIKQNLLERTKRGDTAYINKVRLVRYLKAEQRYANDTDAVYGKEIKCVLMR